MTEDVDWLLVPVFPAIENPRMGLCIFIVEKV